MNAEDAPRLTPRQIEALRVIGRSIEMRGVAPTYREVAAALGLASLNRVAELFRALERAGCFTREPRVARAIKLTSRGKYYAAR